MKPWFVPTIILGGGLIFGSLVPEHAPYLDRSSWASAEASEAIVASSWTYSDEDYYTPLELPPGMILCSPQPDSTYRCIAVPDGTVILFPVPQEAPVDSLGHRK